MRYLIVILFICSKSFSQELVIGIVKDYQSQNVIPYCTISIKNTTKGTVSNEEGAFRLLISTNDTLVFSSIGYKKKSISATDMIKNSIVLLTPNDEVLPEIIVHADNEYLYKVLERCRKHLTKSNTQNSKAYFELETYKNGLPVEFVQSYNNSRIEGFKISSLDIKTGKVALTTSPNGNDFFVSFDIAKAMGMISLVEENKYLPKIPFQMKGQKLKKQFALSVLSTVDNVLHISFMPKQDSLTCFKGEVWIDKSSNKLLKIKMEIINSSIFPFISLAQDTLKNVDLSITKSYDHFSTMSELKFVNFSYSFDYFRANTSPLKGANFHPYKIESNGVIMIYDYGDPFILPYYNFSDGFSDYRKISFLPFSEEFWETGRGLVTTEHQKKNLQYFNQNGINLNFFGEHLQTNNKKFFETNNIYWSEKNRVVLGKELPYDSLSAPKSELNFRSTLYDLDVQLLLIVNELKDKLECNSHTVFDVFKTFYNLPQDSTTNCFINIYFDICEVERRKMQQLLSTAKTLDEIDKIYKLVIQKLDNLSEKYFKDVQTGKNIKELKKWNDYVKTNIGIDNFEIFRIE